MAIDPTDEKISKDREVDDGGLTDDVPHPVECSVEHSDGLDISSNPTGKGASEQKKNP